MSDKHEPPTADSMTMLVLPKDHMDLPDVLLLVYSPDALRELHSALGFIVEALTGDRPRKLDIN